MTVCVPQVNICEQCDNYVAGPEFQPALEAQLADIHTLRDDADAAAGAQRLPATTASSPASMGTSAGSEIWPDQQTFA